MSITLAILPDSFIWLEPDAPSCGTAGLILMMSAAGLDSGDSRARENAELLRRMAGGDRDALAELYDRLSRPLYSTARHILNDASEAQDVVHDVFLALWQSAASFDAARGAVFSWAVALTRNRSIDRLRTRTNRARLLGGSIPDDLGYDSEAGAPGIHDWAELGERADAVRTAVDALPPEQRRALELAFFSGLTQKEIAERLNEPIGTIKARIRRGLLKLRDMLAHRL